MSKTKPSVTEMLADLRNQPEIRIVSTHMIIDQQQAIQIGPLGNGRVFMRILENYFELDRDQAVRMSVLLKGYVLWDSNDE